MLTLRTLTPFMKKKFGTHYAYINDNICVHITNLPNEGCIYRPSIKIEKIDCWSITIPDWSSSTDPLLIVIHSGSIMPTIFTHYNQIDSTFVDEFTNQKPPTIGRNGNEDEIRSAIDIAAILFYQIKNKYKRLLR